MGESVHVSRFYSFRNYYTSYSSADCATRSPGIRESSAVVEWGDCKVTKVIRHTTLLIHSTSTAHIRTICTSASVHLHERYGSVFILEMIDYVESGRGRHGDRRTHDEHEVCRFSIHPVNVASLSFCRSRNCIVLQMYLIPSSHHLTSTSSEHLINGQ